MIDNTTQPDNPTLKKLREREAKLKEQIRQAQKNEASKMKQIHGRKCQLVGAAILEEIKTNAELAGQVNTILGMHTKDNGSRKLLGLPPLKKIEKKAPDIEPEQSQQKTHTESHLKTEKNPGAEKGFWGKK